MADSLKPLGSATCVAEAVDHLETRVTVEDPSTSASGRLFDTAHESCDSYSSDIVKPENASWTPGLVRHLHYHCYSGESDPNLGLLGGVQRQRELAWLGSVGQSLSQRENLDHLYRVMFDLLGSSLHMVERGIVHGNVSWFNIQRQQTKHEPKPLVKRGTDDHHRCIDYILPEKALQYCEPCALITDLNHSTVITTLEKVGYSPRVARTGTPLFIALELSEPEPWDYRWRFYDLQSLVRRFEYLESTYPNPFSRAFPDGNTEFLQCLHEVISLEAEAYESRADRATDPTEPNRLHHDAESGWWVMMWALVRAAPVNEYGQHIEMGNFNRLARYHYSKLCLDLLDHHPGFDLHHGVCVTHPNFVTKYLHTKLKACAEVVTDIATYLTVPWHLYVDRGNEKKTVRRDHAHQAMRRLLLLAILEQQQDAIYLDTNAQRAFDCQPGQESTVSPASTGQIVQNVAHIAFAPPRSSLKRSHADALNSGDVCGGDDPEDEDYQDEHKNTNYKKSKLSETKDEYSVPGRPSVLDWVDKSHVNAFKWFTGHS